MMKNSIGRRKRGSLKNGIAIAALMTVAPVSEAAALQWDFGDTEITLTNTVSMGLGIRTVSQDHALISTLNGGTNPDPTAVNFDDGNLNFDRGDVFSVSTRLVQDLEITHGNIGAFVRAAYFYDFIKNDPFATKRTDLSLEARMAAGRGIDLYDAYIFGDFEVADRPVTVRLGNQVINWGEALYLPGGISQTNALDVSKVVTPGTNLREAYLPSPMIYANVSVMPNISLEAYYQFTWRSTELLPVGTFHSTDDLLGPGAQGLFFAGDPGGTGLSPDQLFALGLGIPQYGGYKARNSGQFGVAARFYEENLSAEFSAYYLRYHSKTPYLSGAATFALTPAPPFFYLAPTGYYGYFPEDIDLFGTSVSLPVGPVSVAAEVAYQPDYPVMLADAVTDAIAQAAATGGQVYLNGYTNANRWNYIANAALTVGPGLPYIGQAPSYILADQIDLMAEVGGVSFAGTKPQGVTGDMFAWGGIVTASATYSDAFGSGITLTPNISYQFAVNGVAIDRASAGTYIEGKRGLTLAVSGSFRNSITASVGYTNNMGGGTYTYSSDRDYVTLSAAYSF